MILDDIRKYWPDLSWYVFEQVFLGCPKDVMTEAVIAEENVRTELAEDRCGLCGDILTACQCVCRPA